MLLAANSRSTTAKRTCFARPLRCPPPPPARGAAVRYADLPVSKGGAKLSARQREALGHDVARRIEDGADPVGDRAAFLLFAEDLLPVRALGGLGVVGRGWGCAFRGGWAGRSSFRGPAARL